ncbi:MAG: aspartate 1-decarboxylase [Pseudomonadota bacterium]
MRRMLKSKIHRATVTDARVHYEGSVTIDGGLMEAADIREYEEVHVWDVTNGVRLTTYAMEGKAGSGQIAMNGAAALLVKKGDIVIIGSFADVDEGELEGHRPRKVFVDAKNQIVKKAENEEC